MYRDCSASGAPELRAQAHAIWRLDDPIEKADAARSLGARDHASTIDPARSFANLAVPGRPPRPPLVTPRDVPRRRLATTAGRIAFYHALAHIEFNAINLALDAAIRFNGLPIEYYADWCHVAQEEACHFQLLCERLAGTDLNARYGDLPAHDGLWEMALKTQHDVLARMALVPRVLEARGLDVTPGLQRKLERLGDARGVAILARILEDEIGHVAIGNHWYRHLCARRQLEPNETWLALRAEYGAPKIRAPLNLVARKQADFDTLELAQFARDAAAKDAG